MVCYCGMASYIPSETGHLCCRNRCTMVNLSQLSPNVLPPARVTSVCGNGLNIILEIHRWETFPCCWTDSKHYGAQCAFFECRNGKKKIMSEWMPLLGRFSVWNCHSLVGLNTGLGHLPYNPNNQLVGSCVWPAVRFPSFSIPSSWPGHQRLVH